MIRFALPVVALCAVLSSADGQDLKVVVEPPKLPENGWVPVYEWTMEWGLRDDKKPTLGGEGTYKTLAAAKAAAQKKLADRIGEKTDWTWIKFVQVTGTTKYVESSELEPKRAGVWKAIQSGLDKERAVRGCNLLVRDVAAAAGVPGLGDKKADEMWGYFNTAAIKDGWIEVKGEKAKRAAPAATAIEAANRLAEEGHLVVGVISKESLNKYKDDKRVKEYGEGHVFVVTPTGGTDWTNTLTANEVLNGGPGTYTLANKVIATPKQHDAVQFFAIPLSKK